MGQFFVWKIFVGICSLFFLPVNFFHGEKVVTVPPVSRSTPERVATTTPLVSVPERKLSPERDPSDPLPVSQEVKTNAKQTPVATTTNTSTFKQTVSTPGALVVAKATPTSTIVNSTKGGTLEAGAIIGLTNTERTGAGFAPLTHSDALSSAAQEKALDMIAKQYFAHVAPDGTDIAALAQKYDYAYLNIGENLALGDFHSSPEVVTGWMNSPGHRANILNKEFTEIGVAAVEGTWKGERVWFAVQEFGRPASACPAPDQLLRDRIVTAQSTLASLDDTLKSLQADIDAAAGDQATLAQKTTDYNAIVNSYNTLVADTKTDIAAYNSEVSAFNICAGLAP